MTPQIVLPLAEFINQILFGIVSFLEPVTRVISRFIVAVTNGVESFLLFWPPLLLIIAIGLIVISFIDRKLGTFTIAGLFLMFTLQLWTATLSTMAILIVGFGVAFLIGIPLAYGIYRNHIIERLLVPILDFMLVLPGFVYLILVVVFFGLGQASVVISIVLFTIAPLVRFTGMALKRVPQELMETAKGLGSSPVQSLIYAQLPAARIDILKGINSSIMMAFEMVVIAALIGAKGLGAEILSALQSVDPGKGLEAGLGIVVLAVLIGKTIDHFAHMTIKLPD